jgi:DNA-directed RNA polymerase specialized sigma24 family protein
LPDSAEEVALVARAAREPLLAIHRHRLRWEDLEDCYGQATLELIATARQGGLRFSSRAHLRNIFEQRFVSRIQDRRRALSGRSPAQKALDGAISLGGVGEREVEIADARADVERRVLLRWELRSLELAAGALSADQRLVLACQIGLQMGREEFCRRFGWSRDKHHKVSQRARVRLRALLDEPLVDMDVAPGAISRGADPSAPGNFLDRGVPFSELRRSRGQGPTYEPTYPHS